MNGSGEVDAALPKRVLYGISCRNYEAAAAAIPGAIGPQGGPQRVPAYAGASARSRRMRWTIGGCEA